MTNPTFTVAVRHKSGARNLYRVNGAGVTDYRRAERAVRAELHHARTVLCVINGGRK